MREGDMVELLKVGCAGWWFVKVIGKSLTIMTKYYSFVVFFFIRKCRGRLGSCGVFRKSAS